MRKIFFSVLLFLFLGGSPFYFSSCSKGKGKLPPQPFNFSFVEGFENSTSLPSGWTLYNPNNDAAWQVVTTVAKTGTNCIGFNNCAGDGNTDMTGRKDRIISPSYDFTGATSASISFDVAYAVLNFKTKIYTDTLAIFASTDGGATWNQVYIKGGTILASVPIDTVAQPCWAPASGTDWRTGNIIVNNLAGHSNVKFAFENRSDWGEWIYLDNISITASNARAPCTATFSKTIQPIIQANCAISGCHVPGGLGPTDFTSYTGIKTDASNGNLKNRMIDGNPSFMPASGKLPDSTLNKVQCWLDAGAPNN